MRIGRITDSKIGKNKDGDKDVRLLTVEISDPDDLQTVELINDAGEDNNPPIDSNVIILNLGDSWPVAIAVDDGIEPDALVVPGERILYASVGGSIVAYVKSDILGNVEVNGDTDFAVAYTDLDAALQTMVGLINTELGKISTAIGLLGGTYTVVPVTVNIAPAQVSTVKLP